MAWRSRGHRGDELETLIERTNDYYKKMKIARIDKIPTPITTSKMNEKGQIVLGYFEKKSTVDFIGMVQGNGICFDAKETNLKSLPLQNIHEHQLSYMKDFKEQGGIPFMIVHFKAFDKYFFVPYEILQKYADQSKKGGRKSIPFDALLTQAYEIPIVRGGLLNYLSLINIYLDDQKHEEFQRNLHK